MVSGSVATKAWPYAAFLIALLLAPVSGQAQRGSGPFDGLAGSWSGSGSVTLSSGAQEALRCRATYDVENAGHTVKMRLRCASDSYKFELNGNVVSEGGRLGGTWSEDTRQVSGSVSGKATSENVDARISGPTFGARIVVTTRSKRNQSVTISSDGQYFQRVAITMNRAGG
jgi:hypothetical protein